MLFLFLILTQTVPQDTAPQERPNSLANLPECKLMMPLLITKTPTSSQRDNGLSPTHIT